MTKDKADVLAEGELPELLPCPFCCNRTQRERMRWGGVKLKRDDYAYLKPEVWIALCLDCGANGANKSSELEAAIAWNTRASAVRVGVPLCPIHKRLEDAGKLEAPVSALGCVACSLNERQELLEILAPCAPADKSRDSVTVLREVVEFHQTHVGKNRAKPQHSPLPEHVDGADVLW